VYKLNDELAIVQTVDFFTPIVDDPFAFGQIAAANALSDVYAMGGRPITALNLVCFPVKNMDISILRRTLAGGLDKMREAGVLLVGGHSIDDKEMKYGLSVTGTIHPERVIRNTGAVAGDRLILTKPLGTGIINTAIKAGDAGPATIRKTIACMAALNDRASELMQQKGVNACTDVTGFGLLGHAAEMIGDTGIGLVIDTSAVPHFPEALELAELGMVPGGLYRNLDFRSPMVDVEKGVPAGLVELLYDPQTSGGLLIAVPGDKAPALLAALHEKGITDAAIIGEATTEHPGRIEVR
jgi:selenide,water dikinase